MLFYEQLEKLCDGAILKTKRVSDKVSGRAAAGARSFSIVLRLPKLGSKDGVHESQEGHGFCCGNSSGVRSTLCSWAPEASRSTCMGEMKCAGVRLGSHRRPLGETGSLGRIRLQRQW